MGSVALVWEQFTLLKLLLHLPGANGSGEYHAFLSETVLGNESNRVYFRFNLVWSYTMSSIDAKSLTKSLLVYTKIKKNNVFWHGANKKWTQPGSGELKLLFALYFVTHMFECTSILSISHFSHLLKSLWAYCCIFSCISFFLVSNFTLVCFLPLYRFSLKHITFTSATTFIQLLCWLNMIATD